MSEWIITLNETIIRRFSIADGEKLTIGRGAEANIVLDNTAISRLHTSIEATAGIFLISDLGSTNGTFVNGKKVHSNEPVSETAVITFGKFRMTPASATDADRKIADSVSANIMDLDEETIFVSGGQPAPPNKPSGNGNKARITLVSGNARPKELVIEGRGSIKIGKGNSCDIVLSGFFVAKTQCYIFKRDKAYFIVPQRSWVGTFVNGAKISHERKLASGDLITVSKTSLRYTI